MSFVREPGSSMRRPLLWACLCAGLVFAWQTLTVAANYRGDWSALFYTGSWIRTSALLEEEETYRIPNDRGYDGQFYHLVAHDPFLRHDAVASVDNPRLRWRRILLPLVAWTLALGQSEYIDSAYAATVLGFVLLGAFWLATYCVRTSLHPAMSLAFPLIPAVLVSIDRFTIDVALAALCVGLLVEKGWRLFLILALAPLARETGVILPLAFGVWSLSRRKYRPAGAAAGALVPYALWLAYLYGRTSPDLTVFASWIPFVGLGYAVVHPPVGQFASSWLRAAGILDYVALLGICAAVLLAAWAAVQRPRDLAAVAAALFTGTVVAFTFQMQAWDGAYSFARTMSPVLLFLALYGLAQRSWIHILPMALTLPRLLFQLSPQWRGILAFCRSELGL